MNINYVRRVVSQIKSTLFKNSNSHSIGMLKSHFRGSGLQFKEHQVYTHGDDVRFIDWKILAKTNQPYVKTFEEERNVEISVLIDCSPTMLNGYNGKSKLEAAIEITCLLYLLAKETKDYVQAIIIADEVISLPKKSGEEGISYLISRLEKMGVVDRNGHVDFKYRREIEIPSAEKQKILMKHVARKKEVVILSDFNNFLDMSLLKMFVYQSHVHAFRVIGPLDSATKMPYMALFQERIGSLKGELGDVDFKGGDEEIDLFGKRIKTINVKDRYLEEFIEEML